MRYRLIVECPNPECERCQMVTPDDVEIIRIPWAMGWAFAWWCPGCALRAIEAVSKPLAFAYACAGADKPEAWWPLEMTDPDRVREGWWRFEHFAAEALVLGTDGALEDLVGIWEKQLAGKDGR